MNALVKRKAVGGRQEIRHIGGRGSLAGAIGLTRHIGSALEEKRHGNLEDMGNLLQPAGANSVGSLLVFLHLLKRKAEGVAELLLTHSKHHSPHSDSAAYMLVGRIRRLFRHHNNTPLRYDRCSQPRMQSNRWNRAVAARLKVYEIRALNSRSNCVQLSITPTPDMAQNAISTRRSGPCHSSPNRLHPVAGMSRY